MADVFDVHQQWFDNSGGFLVGGKVYYGIPNTDPTILANQINIFADRGFITPLPNPQTIGFDGRVENKPFLGQRYSIQVDDQFDVTSYSSPDQGENPVATTIALSNVDGINDITADANPKILEYVDKQQYTLTIKNENTGAVTLDIDQLGPITIKDQGLDIIPGQFPANQIITVAFNVIGPVFDLVGGTNLSSPPPIGDSSPNTVASTEFTGPLGTVIQNLVSGTIIKAFTRLEGILGSVNPATIRGTTLQVLLGAIINELSIDGTLGGNSDSALVTEKAIRTFMASNFFSPPPIGNGVANTIEATTFEALFGNLINDFSNDGTLGGNSSSALVTEQAIRTFIASNFSSPPAIGNVSPNNIDGLIIKAFTRFEGILGSVNPANVDGLIIKAVTRFEGILGSINPATVNATDIDGTVIKAATRFEGPLGSTNPAPVKATTFEGDAGGTTINEFSTDVNLAGDSDDAVPTERATKAYADTKLSDGVGIIDQAKLKTTTGEVIFTNNSFTTPSTFLFTLPGGQYGFWPEIKHAVNSGSSGGWLGIGNVITSLTYTSRILLTIDPNGVFNSLQKTTAQQRYIQASPPYIFGGRLAHSFIFGLIENGSGKIIAMYHAPDPVWANNGPTCIEPEYEKNGKLYRKRCIIDKTKDIRDPDRKRYIEQEITNDFKNSDMELIPHPFDGNDMTGKSIILIDPNDPIVLFAENMKNDGESALEELFINGYVQFGNEHLKGRATPHSSVMVVKPTWRNSK